MSRAVLSDAEVSKRARRLAALIEPVVGQVYFSPECHEAYAALGFSPSPGEGGGKLIDHGASLPPWWADGDGFAPDRALVQRE